MVGKRGEEIPQLRQIRRLEINHHMPAELVDAAGDLHQLVARGEVDQPLDEIEAYAAHALFVHRCEFGVTDIALHRRNAARASAGMHQRVDHGAVVGAVAGRLHHHIAGKAEMVAQRIELLVRRVAGRVFALRRKRKFGAGAEHMAMRIDRARRQLKARL